MPKSKPWLSLTIFWIKYAVLIMTGEGAWLDQSRLIPGEEFREIFPRNRNKKSMAIKPEKNYLKKARFVSATIGTSTA